MGRDDAPADDSPDEENCKWCKDHGAILVTNDRGKKDKVILVALAAHHVDAIFVYRDLRTGPPGNLAKAILAAEGKIDALRASKKLIHHRLRPSGNLVPR